MDYYPKIKLPLLSWINEHVNEGFPLKLDPILEELLFAKKQQEVTTVVPLS